MKNSAQWFSLSLACAALACAPSGNVHAPAGRTAQPLTIANGDNPNGDNPNGDNPNGDNPNGDNPNGSGLGNHVLHVALAGATMNGTTFDSMTIDGSQLKGQLQGSPVTGYSMVGAHFTGTSDTGMAVNISIHRVVHEAPPNNDTWEYETWFYNPVLGYEEPLCPDANGNPLTAFALVGWWNFGSGGTGQKIEDSTVFTFACKDSGAIGKCVSPIGYKPWASVNGTSLDRVHQACIRLLRADYCGDGVAHTIDGNMVDLYDNLGIQFDTESWLFEAEWDENGARCVTSNLRGGTSFSCYAAKYSSTCGSLGDFNAGTLLMDEIPSTEVQP